MSQQPRITARARSSRANGKLGGRPRVPPPDVPDAIDELDALRRMLARLDAATEALYSPASKIGRRERDKEVRANARAMGALVPRARLRRAELVVRGEVDAIAAAGKDPKLTKLRSKKVKE